MNVKKLVVLLGTVIMLLGSLQMSCEAIPGYITLKDYKPLPIYIPKNKGDEKFDLTPQPGYQVTLLPNQTVKFAWGSNTAKKLVIKDSSGTKVLEEVIGGKNSIDIIPREKNLKAGQEYFWSVDDNSKSYEFKILDEETEKQLLDELAKIDAENFSTEECAIEKANYLLMLSEEYSETFDFYWLIAQWLEKISPKDKELMEKKSELLTRCSIHLDDEM